jgi:hypothetical protein
MAIAPVQVSQLVESKLYPVDGVGLLVSTLVAPGWCRIACHSCLGVQADLRRPCEDRLLQPRLASLNEIQKAPVSWYTLAIQDD